jgi:hypothetical protein
VVLPPPALLATAFDMPNIYTQKKLISKNLSAVQFTCKCFNFHILSVKRKMTPMLALV